VRLERRQIKVFQIQILYSNMKKWMYTLPYNVSHLEGAKINKFWGKHHNILWVHSKLVKPMEVKNTYHVMQHAHY
jgi:hypothetical protein